MVVSELKYTAVPERALKAIKDSQPLEVLVADRMQNFTHVSSRSMEQTGDTEALDNVIFTHHFIDVPGDGESVTFHYVETGAKESEHIVFLHGMPDTWYQWHHTMAALSAQCHCIAFDLKGYGQSEKKPGDYRHEGASEQLFDAIRKVIGEAQFNIVSHDRGTVQADYIVANHPSCILRYGRGEQHLYHFNPVLAPQGDLLAEAPRNKVMDDPVRFIVWSYTWIAERHLPQPEMERVIQEFMYPDVKKAVPRYYQSATFRSEWLDRRNRLIAGWKGMPILVMQAYNSRTQPREFYEGVEEFIPNAKEVKLKFMPGGHFWTLECPNETTDAVKELLAMSPQVF